MDELLLRGEADEATHRAGAEAVEGFRAEVARKLQTVLGVRTRVEIVVPHSITRTDFKARRVIDDREVFRELNDQLAREAR
jgi:phenylacetate-CoA ligase